MATKMNNVVVYHHNDLDGMASGYIIHNFLPDVPAENFYSCNYTDKLDKHNLDSEVYIVDLAIKYADLLEACKTSKKVIFIDHHISSFNMLKEHAKELEKFDIAASCDIKYCAALLTAMWINSHPTPNWGKSGISSLWSLVGGVRTSWLMLVDDNDLRKNVLPEAKYFALGCYGQNVSTTISQNGLKTFNPFWDKIEIIVEQLINDGKAIERYNTVQWNRNLSGAFEWEFEGSKFLCLNGRGGMNIFCGREESYDAVIAFSYDGKSGLWYHSVYSAQSSNFDCAEFSKKFGGGGHFHAAGFQRKELIFDI